LIFDVTFGSSLGPIPVELTRLRKLEDVNMTYEPLLEGFGGERFFHFILVFFGKNRRVSSN